MLTVLAKWLAVAEAMFVFFIYAQFLQDGRGYTALQSGLASTPFAVGSAVAAGLGGPVVTRIGRKLIVGGLVLVIIGLVASWVWVEHRSSWQRRHRCATYWRPSRAASRLRC